MARTKLGGNRLAHKSIKTEHLSDDIRIPESNIQLNHGTHNHENKVALDLIKNTNPQLVKELDLKDVVLTIMEVANAREEGLTLQNTLEGKASKAVMDELVSLVGEAVGNEVSLKAALEAIQISLDDKINSHAGVRGHKDLDILYEDISNAKGDFTTLTSKLNSLASAGGGTGEAGTGDITIQAMSTWETTIELQENQQEIILPNPYRLGDGSLMIYEGPLLLMPGSENDYTEVTGTSVLLNENLPAGTILRIIGTNAGRLYDWIYRMKSVDNQTAVDTVFSYSPGLDELVVYEDGLLLQAGEDFLEVGEHQIQMVLPMPANCNLTICKRRY